MSEAMIVQGTALQIKEYRGKRVVTFKDIDTVHKRPDGTAKRNFDNNRSHFISGVDFFKIPMKEFSTNIVPNSYKGGNPNNLVTLITETGYLMLVKSFTDDLAWKVQRELVDSYFRVNEGFVEQTVTVTETPSDMVYKNNEGYVDPTAGVAMGHVKKEEQDVEKLNHKIIQSFRLLVDLAGFEIVGRVTLKHKKSGRIFK